MDLDVKVKATMLGAAFLIVSIIRLGCDIQDGCDVLQCGSGRYSFLPLMFYESGINGVLSSKTSL